MSSSFRRLFKRRPFFVVSKTKKSQSIESCAAMQTSIKVPRRVPLVHNQDLTYCSQLFLHESHIYADDDSDYDFDNSSFDWGAGSVKSLEADSERSDKMMNTSTFIGNKKIMASAMKAPKKRVPLKSTNKRPAETKNLRPVKTKKRWRPGMILLFRISCRYSVVYLIMV